jgi:hypothetical protein
VYAVSPGDIAIRAGQQYAIRAGEQSYVQYFTQPLQRQRHRARKVTNFSAVYTVILNASALNSKRDGIYCSLQSPSVIAPSYVVGGRVIYTSHGRSEPCCHHNRPLLAPLIVRALS